ncbi:MAG: SDR family oxidoreductase [Deltaproteobacteria bacterium]|nr:SDR family oxidoreductase [Deltaproteobacteria bacterium]
MRLKDKVAIVTGGGGGLGQGICLRLAQEGANVVVSDINLDLAQKTVQAIEETGQKAVAVQADVRSKADCTKSVNTAIEAMGRLDILVCGAGVGGFDAQGDTGEPAILENISEAEWDLTMDVNLKGVFLCNQAAAPHFKNQQSGKIINISSIGGRKGVDFIPHYCASKSGVLLFSQAVALQLAPFNINVNCICPGVIWTEMWRKGAQALSHTIPDFKGMDLDTIFGAMVEQMIPMKRPQTPADIGNAVVFLASSEADQITGQALNVCGGAAMN